MDKTSGGSVTRTITYYPIAGAMRINSTMYYTLKDHLGSASVVTDASGNVVGEQRYYPFGETRLSTGTIFTDKQFTSQQNVSGLGIYNYGARFYSPKLGRFLSADSIVPSASNPQAYNRYSYVLNNPLRYIDPSGHMPCNGEFCQEHENTNTNQPGCGGTGQQTCLGGDPKPEKDEDPNPSGLTSGSTIGNNTGDDWWADNGGITWWVDIGSYSPTEDGWHNYAVGPDLVCPAMDHCTPEEMKVYLSEFAYPGQNPFEPVSSGDISLVKFPNTNIPGGYVQSFISDDGLQAVNQTLPLHPLYDGVAVRTVFQGVDGAWYITTHSYGNNHYGTAGINNSQGPIIFTTADQQMLNQVIQDHQTQVVGQ